MKPARPVTPRLTKNDKTVLKNIIDYAKVSDTEIARRMKISAQAVFKIRNKLERLGIIKGYIPIIDYRKIGIRVMVLLIIKITTEVWNKFTDEQISQKIKRIPHITAAYRVPDSKASHILLMGFRDISQKDNYLTRIQTLFGREVELNEVYTFSVDKIITQNPVGLLYEIIDEKHKQISEFFLNKN
ncbi:winged helix-turn-helix transcriptional regulator [Candidatus Woesearchaeota archaeon]|nr:winged helix-turn-helix transcriptional regulator [Candidatus Woesearchaeota archaeon]